MFGAVHCGVPVIDMLRYHKFSAGRYWTPEYGNAEADPEHFKFMMAYSPLHNVRQTTPIRPCSSPPPTRTTAWCRCKKFAATLQAADNGRNPSSSA
ncbi:MAG: prolyl oligopeptidase family serine peptidase [Chloroflexota bacterium]